MCPVKLIHHINLLHVIGYYSNANYAKKLDSSVENTYSQLLQAPTPFLHPVHPVMRLCVGPMLAVENDSHVMPDSNPVSLA
jgi:hypothetical protein